jgi:carbon monoxide dehydrogenase subunit G
MELEQEFTVPVPRADAWAVLMDVERIAPCMPGATFDGFQDDGSFKGRVKVKLGPITVTYHGSARFAERDEEAGTAVIEASGKEARGPGTAAATIRAQLDDAEDGSTRVRCTTDLNVTGKPAQFGRGVMAEVSAKLVGQFADCLATQLGGGGDESAAAPGAPAEPAVTEPSAAEPASAVPRTEPTPLSRTTAPRAQAPPEETRPTADAIDLLDTAGVPVLKRVLPVVAALLVGVVLWRLLRRRRR